MIVAMPVEVAPLLDGVKAEQVNGVDLFVMPNAVMAIGGIGEKFARRAAEVAIDWAHPKLLLSAGIVGAISPKLKVGEVGRIREVIEVATGEIYPASGDGDWVLATSQRVSGAAEKQQLFTKFGADVVDMEAAAVAQVARERGLRFAAIKSISDEAEFDMPPLDRFVDQGKFDTRRFLVYVALHPRWWRTLGKIKKNSEIAAENLCRAVGHLIEVASD
ncbi:MAG: nucleoside phosphorylase [Candidatus Korobacteraceae bacterium]